MTNLFDYLEWRGDLTFAQDPFHIVDNLILSCMAYVVLDGIVDGFDSSTTITVAEAANQFVKLLDSEKRLRDERDMELFIAMANSKRFGTLELLYYVAQTDRRIEKQFAAITVKLGTRIHYVAYRGTDCSVVGWKEDFNMTFCSGVPAQLEAVDYLRQVAVRTDGILYIGGHSKGGNLAVYAASFVGVSVQKRIEAIYNNDGPGFLEDVIHSTGYQAIYARIQTLIPQTSLFGMMLEHAEPFTIVKSTERFVMQHDPYSWCVMGRTFLLLEEVTSSGRFLDATIRNWLAEISVEQREQFVDTIYKILAAEDAATLRELTQSWLNNPGARLKVLHQIDNDTWKMIECILMRLVQIMGHTAQDVFWEEHVEKIQPWRKIVEQKLGKSMQKHNNQQKDSC